MTPAQQRAMLLGCELDAINGARRGALRQGTAAAHEAGPRALACHLMALASVDRRRRALRGLLAEQLEASRG